MRCSLRELARILDGRPTADGAVDPDGIVVDGVDLDSRTLPPGALFVPLVAERDGHDFVPAALERGAAAFLTDRELPGPGVVVSDTGEALTALGRWARSRIDGPVIGITGSVGKTSVKDLIAAAVGADRPTHANPRSFNNELGLPLTLFNTPETAEVVVVEMGARGIGHIATLCEIGRPTMAVVTRIALAHSELFGDLAGVARAKGELVEALDADGVAFLNADDPEVARLAERTNAGIVTYGEAPTATVRLTAVESDELLRPTATVVTPDGTVRVRVPRSGHHMAHNATAAVAVAWHLGIDPATAAAGIESAPVSPWRMEVTTATGGGIVINDAYNANPTSVRAALEVLAGLDRPRRIAVLGVMAELGSEGLAEHRAIAEEARSAGIDVVAVGAPDYGDDVVHVTDAATAAAVVGDPGPDTAVLVKGSRVAGLERLAADWSRP